MSEHVNEEAQKALLEDYKGRFMGRVGFGKKPAVLVVDFVRAYTTPGASLYAEPVVGAVAATAPLLEQARKLDVPVIYTVVEYAPSALDGGLFVKKVPVLLELTRGAALGRIVPELEPHASDVVIAKQYASAFFGTSLASTLTAHGIDTVILTGCSTSGCIRATAVDGLQHGFRMIVPRECVGDRSPAPHEANLFDINAKYGDVVSLAEVESYLEGLKRV